MRFVIVFLLSLTAADAQTFGEWSGLNQLLGRPPTGADVLLEIHRFDLFEQISAGMADQRGDAALRMLSESESDASENRDGLLMQLDKDADLNIKFGNEPSLTGSEYLAGLQGSVGETFVREYYQDQVAEHESAISLLQRYIAKPDNEAVKTLALKLVPALKMELVTAKTSLANSNATAKRTRSRGLPSNRARAAASRRSVSPRRWDEPAGLRSGAECRAIYVDVCVAPCWRARSDGKHQPV
jgi:Domain of unknown function (DUF4142)